MAALLLVQPAGHALASRLTLGTRGQRGTRSSNGIGVLTRIARSANLGSILPAGLMQTRPPPDKAGSGPPHPTPLRAETSIAFDLRSTRCWIDSHHDNDSPQRSSSRLARGARRRRPPTFSSADVAVADENELV